MDVSTVATDAEAGVEGFMKIEPFIATGLGFVPQAAPIVALVHPAVVAAAPYIEQALKDLAAGNGGDAFGAFISLLQHVAKGQPNSPVLSPSADPSAQGSA